MKNDKERALRYILDWAITCQGRAYYNPCMFNLGFTDQIRPSRQQNDALRRYGCLHYGVGVDPESPQNPAWTYFEINEDGRRYMAALAPRGLSKAIRKLLSLCLVPIQYLSLGEGWLSYAMGSVVVSLFSSISYFSLLWMPLDWVFKYLWMLCDGVEHLLWNRYFTWEASSQRWRDHFPRL